MAVHSHDHAPNLVMRNRAIPAPPKEPSSAPMSGQQLLPMKHMMLKKPEHSPPHDPPSSMCVEAVTVELVSPLDPSLDWAPRSSTTEDTFIENG